MKSFTPLILITVSILLFFFHLEPEYQRLLDLQEESRDFQALLAQADELSDVRESLREKQEGFDESDLQLLRVIIPDSFDLVEFVHDLDGVAERNNVSIGNVSDSVNSFNSSLDRAVISFNFETSFTNFLRFLDDLENSLRIIDVTYVDIRTPSDETNVHNYNLTLQTYWFSQE